MVDSTNRKMIIGVTSGNGYGFQPGAWRMPGVDPTSYTSYDARVKHAQAAERGKLQFIFLPDGPFTDSTAVLETEAPNFNLDVMMTLAAVARETKRIGLVATSSTTFNAPYTIAKQFKALDIMSHGRAGWNAITSTSNDVAAIYGETIPSSKDRYGRAHEVVQLVQAFWGSWGKEAWVHNQQTGQFARHEEISTVHLKGNYIRAKGTLYIPPSEQGQPIVFHAGGSPNAHELAGRFANVVIGAAFTIEDSIQQRNAFRESAKKYGRDPNEIKFIAGMMTTIVKDRRTALDRRLQLMGDLLPQRVAYLQQMLGIRLDSHNMEDPLSAAELAAARPSPFDPRSAYALKIAKEGWSLQDIIAHGVIDYHPSIVGPGIEAADHMQAWFDAGACDGFWISPDILNDGIDAFVDEVVPILQERGLFHQDYEGTTLRAHIGAPEQYGIDPRV